MADKKWIQKAIKKPGALHKQLGIPRDKKLAISFLRKRLAQLKKQGKTNTKLYKRIQLALTLKRLRKKKKRK